MSDWIQGLIFATAPLVIGYLWNLLLSRERSVILGWSLAHIIGKLTGQKLGKKGSDIIIGRFSTSIDDLTFGMRLWLSGKPKPTVEELKARAKAAAAKPSE